MPLLPVPSEGSSAVEIYFELHGDAGAGPTVPRVLLIMGFGAPGSVWAPQLADLLAAKDESHEPPMCVCILDNRGVGQSSCPPRSCHYTTEIMAGDALAVMDHLGWDRFHLAGHSMGGMIACKLAALAPQRVRSLSVISATGGGWQAVPQTAMALWLGLKKLFVRSVRSRAEVDVRFHFSPSLLREVDPVTKEPRLDTVVGEYVEAYLAEEERPGHGARGQMAAVLRHRLRKRDVKSIQLGQFPVQVIHGRQDCLAVPKYAERLAARLQAPCVMLEGGHFVIREQAAAVNALLRAIILHPAPATSFANVERYPYMPFLHWVAVVEQHRERHAQLAAQRAEQAKCAAAHRPGEGSAHQRRPSWQLLPLRLWRSSSGGSSQRLAGGSPTSQPSPAAVWPVQQQPGALGASGGCAAQCSSVELAQLEEEGGAAAAVSKEQRQLEPA